MKYERILKTISEAVWQIHPPKLEEILGVIEARASGLTIEAGYLEKIEERRKSNLGRHGRVEVLGIHGTITQRPSLFASGGTSTMEFSRQFEAAVNDPEVKGILLDVDSPGGEVFGVYELAKRIFDARGTKPIVAVANPEAYSAAYKLATSAERVFVQPTGMVGSVGTLATHIDQSKFDEGLGIEVTFIHAGKYKVEGNSHEPLGDEARAEIQRHVDRYHGMFLAALARNRGITTDQVAENFGQGRVVGAEAAVRRGMADAVGTFEDALASLEQRIASEDRMSLKRRRTAFEKVRAPAP